MGYVDGMSLYEYVGSNPISRNDPSGLVMADANELKGAPSSKVNWSFGNSSD